MSWPPGRRRGARNNRPDHGKGHRTQYERNRMKVIKENDICALCGRPVDKRLKYPDPWSATADHIIPVSRGGHPSAIENLQLAHLKCNRDKCDKIAGERRRTSDEAPEEYRPEDPRGLEWSIPWEQYRADDRGNNAAELAEEMEKGYAKGMILTSVGWIPKNKKL